MYIHKYAYHSGFSDFLRGEHSNPYDEMEKFNANREWQRGQNAAYKMCLERTQRREVFRKQRG